MGLFSSKKTYYSSGVTREPLMDEYPDPFKMSIIQAVVSGGDLVEALKAAERASFSTSAAAYMHYGETSFDYKLPTASVSYGEINTANLTAILESIAGQPIVLGRNELALADSGIGYAYRVEYTYVADVNDLQRRISEASNLITTVADAVTALESEILNVAFTVDTLSTLALYDMILANAEASGTISTTDRTTIQNAITGSPTIVDQVTTNAASFAGYSLIASNNNIDEVTAQYATVLQETVTVRAFYYEIKDGTYPALSNTTDLTDRYLPIVPIKENGAYIPTSSTLYETGDTLLSKLGLTTQSFKDALASSSIAPRDVKTTFFAFTADMKTADPSTLKYLFVLWEKEAIANSVSSRVSTALHPAYIAASTVTSGSYFLSTGVFVPATPPKKVSIDIVENTYTSHIQYSGIRSDLLIKTIGAVGDVVSHTTNLPDGYAEVAESYFGGFITKASYNRSYITFEKQVTPTSVISIRVQGLINTTAVRGQIGMDVLATLTNGEALYIPVNFDLLQEFSAREKSEILVRSMSLVLYWQHVQVVKTGFFGSTFFKILSIVFKVVMFAYGAGQFAEFLSGIASGAISALEALTTVATNALISVGLDMVLTKLAEIGGVFAVIAAVYMMYKFDVGGFGSAVDDAVMPLAEQLMKAVTLVTNTMAEAIGDATALGYDLLNAESERFLMSAKDKQEELDKAKDLLGDIDNMYNPLLVRYSTDHFVSTESPTAFYNRALNTNPGVAALSYISSYAAIGVSLPEWNGVYQVEVTPDSI